MEETHNEADISMEKSDEMKENNENLQNIIKGMIYGFVLGEFYGLQNKYKLKTISLNLGFPKITETQKLSYYSKHMLLTLDTIINSTTVNYCTEGLNDIDFKYYVENLKKNEKKEELSENDNYLYEVINHTDYDNNPLLASFAIYESKQRSAAFVNPLARCMPLSLLYFVTYLQEQQIIPEFYRNIASICQIIHFDTRCVVSCIAYCIILQRIIGNRLLGINLGNIKLYCYNIINLIMRVRGQNDYPDKYNYNLFMDELLSYFNCHITDLKLEALNDYVYKTLGCILWMADIIETFNKTRDTGTNNPRGELDFARILNVVVNECGHSDINTAVVGSLIGAYIGYNKLPIHWINALPEKNIIDDKVNALLQHMHILNN